jgi:hypothetical protein
MACDGARDKSYPRQSYHITGKRPHPLLGWCRLTASMTRKVDAPGLSSSPTSPPEGMRPSRCCSTTRGRSPAVAELAHGGRARLRRWGSCPRQGKGLVGWPPEGGVAARGRSYSLEGGRVVRAPPPVRQGGAAPSRCGTGKTHKGNKSHEGKNESLPFITSGRWVIFCPKASESRGEVLLDLYYSKSCFWAKAPVAFWPFG